VTLTLRSILAVGLIATSPMIAPLPALAQATVVATVNGKSITETDLKLAEAEIGADLGNLPEPTKRRVLIEFLIENQLFAEAAEGQKLAQGGGFDDRMQYWRRRALRDTYFDQTVKSSVSDTEAKKFYDSQIAQMKPQEELKARHILVESKDKAKEVFEKIAHGGDFAKLAKEFSKDPGSKDDGGDLGFFGRGQMVPQFEEAAFALKPGDVSQPIETQFGWHLIRIDEKREKTPPAYDQVKDRIVASMIHRKAQELATDLRTKAKVDYVDPAVKKMIEDEKAAAAQPAPGGAPPTKKP
jgi:peptidyl-prolyl cis-trans isomerase C